MDHQVSTIPRILEILEIEVSNIFYNPGNIGNSIFFLVSTILEIRGAGRRLQGLGFGGLDYFWNMFLEFPDILEICFFCFVFLWCFQKRRAPKFHAEPTDG